jgi:hypothetical protein
LAPPDLYAIAGALLKRSGAYLRVFEHDGQSRYLDDLSEIGAGWRTRLDALEQPITVPKLRAAVPSQVKRAWKTLNKYFDISISKIRESPTLAEQLIRMALIADEASGGIGIDQQQDGDDVSDSPGTFLTVADWMLRFHEARSFCWEVSADAICVLGKQHTPARGATFRSLSHHLSLHPQ